MCVSVCQCNHCDRKNTCTDCTYNEVNKNVICTPPFGKGVQNCPEYKPFKYVTVPKFEYKPIPEETLLKMDYKPPIEAIRHEMEMRFENDVMKVVQQHDIFVDKDELLKALQYDRDQYRKGFEDGYTKHESKVAREIYVAIYNEIIEARNSNFEAIKERKEKHNVNRYEDTFCNYCDGKIHALDGILYFIEDVIEKYTKDKEGE